MASDGTCIGCRGYYRALFDLHQPAQVILLHGVDHRAHVYRPR